MPQLSAFKAKVIDLAAERMDSSNAFDLTDDTTKSYVQGLFTAIVESVGCEPKELFGFTAEDFAKPMAEAKFAELGESDDTTEEVYESAAQALADDTVALFGLFKENAEKQEEFFKVLTPVEESAGDGVKAAEGEDTAADTTDTKKTEGEETVAEGAAAADEGGDGGADEQVAEGGAEFTIVDPAERIDSTPWSDVDKAAMKDRLRTVVEAGGAGIEVIVQDVYAVVGSLDDPATWKYPHHIIEESGAVVLSSTGLGAASNFLQSGRFTGSDDQKQTAAGHLQGHYDQIQTAGEGEGETVKEAAGYPMGLGVAAAKTAGVRTVSIEMIQDENILPFEVAAMTDEGKNIAVVEAVANLVQGAGMLSSISDPTLLTISPDQFGGVSSGLNMIANALMGTLPEGEGVALQPDISVEESAARIDELETQMKVLEAAGSEFEKAIELRDTKISALSMLSEGSALEGIAESVVGSKTIEQVKAFKAVTETPGLKRLITAAGNTIAPVKTEGEEEIITESGAGTRGLENLETIFDDKTKKTKETPRRKSGNFAGLYV